MGRRKRRRRSVLAGRGPRWAIFLAVMVALYYLVTGIAPALDKARGLVTDIGREASLLFR